MRERSSLVFNPFDGVGLAYASSTSSKIESLPVSLGMWGKGFIGYARAIVRALGPRVYQLDTVYLLTKGSDDSTNTYPVRCANRAMIAITYARGARIVAVDADDLAEAQIALGSDLTFHDAPSCAVVAATLLRRAMFAGVSLGQMAVPTDRARVADGEYLRQTIQKIRKSTLNEKEIFGTIESADS
jgi:hypothetical protein